VRIVKRMNLRGTILATVEHMRAVIRGPRINRDTLELLAQDLQGVGDAMGLTVGEIVVSDEFRAGRAFKFTSSYGHTVEVRCTDGVVYARGDHDGEPCPVGGDCHLWAPIRLLPILDLDMPAAFVTEHK
jgi:hypothetical protein